ncbi:uncharacterized protein MONOS_17564 [Monocercomonoides exilis]|uniref:uncharacterized protein n=1 Tax=Monocercomonoides exilis TaxID=2049356 RepID=UPI00355A9DFF|nr:hypothetical protein MONOS_17564 [Monocercomonoides exilis]
MSGAAWKRKKRKKRKKNENKQENEKEKGREKEKEKELEREFERENEKEKERKRKNKKEKKKNPKGELVDNEAVHCRWAVGEDAGRAEHAADKKPGSTMGGRAEIQRKNITEEEFGRGEFKKLCSAWDKEWSEGADLSCEHTYPVSSSEAVL